MKYFVVLNRDMSKATVYRSRDHTHNIKCITDLIFLHDPVEDKYLVQWNSSRVKNMENDLAKKIVIEAALRMEPAASPVAVDELVIDLDGFFDSAASAEGGIS